jgi:alpha-1,2-mannosyltransferase
VVTTSEIVGSPPVGDTRRARLVYVAGIAPLLVLAVASLVHFVWNFNTGSLGFDFRGAYLWAGEAVLDGRSPYPPLEGPALASQTAYVYPPLLAYLVVPFTLLPEGIAAVLAVLLVAAVLSATLAVLGVRDLRCYAAAALWAPTVNALHMASASALVAFAAALAWRYRATVWPLATALGLGIAVKVILWPLLVWTLVTGRVRATVLGAVVAAGVTLPLWAALSFDGLDRYPDLLRRLTELEAHESYSLSGALQSVGVSDTASQAIAIAAAFALLAGCVLAARRSDDFAAFTLALGAALVLSPIVWLHYFVLLLVPLAIARPRFSTVWLLPLLLWLTPLNGNGEAIQPFLPACIAAATIVLVLLASDRPRTARASAPPPVTEPRLAG